MGKISLDTENIAHSRALSLLQQMLGSNAKFRSGQWQAIESVAILKKRTLLIQRTGWGKSIVYFLATKLLREQGAGPTLLISPLLSLMRNQIEMAERIGIHAATIHSANRSEWEAAEEALNSDECDILLISPERLNNERFLNSTLPGMKGRVGLFVVDEAHCISDWGHDFRPDYRRIVRILNMLPQNIPVMGTTATANERVIADVQTQLGQDLLVQRGPLGRNSLRLQNISLANQSERLAWLAENLPKLKGSGVVYCLTVLDANRVAEWLKRQGFNAAAYHAGDDVKIDRPALEQAFLKNEIQILVATVALGMGFDKPDISFVIHFQRPGSVVAYYQQVGRAGRAVERAYGILLSGVEDDEIQNYFINTAFPSQEIFEQILNVLEQHESLSFYDILSYANVTPNMAEKALKLLELDGAVGRTYDSRLLYFRTPNPWQPDVVRINRVQNQRRTELSQMQTYLTHEGCLMEFLQRALDDPAPTPCKRCANCCGAGLPVNTSHQLVNEAEDYLNRVSVVIKPRKMWPQGLFPGQKRTIPAEALNCEGRALCYYGDAGWGQLVRDGKYIHGHFSDELVLLASQLISKRWKPAPFPKWMTAIPSRRHPNLVPEFAKRLADRIGVPFHTVFERTADVQEQKNMQNSSMQSRNVIHSLQVKRDIPKSPVLLVDDIIDSGWTLTIAGYLLRQRGSGKVYPFTLARASGKKTLS